jgi:protein phosphatase PTC2/3
VRGYNEDRISIVLDLKKPGVVTKAKAAEQDPAKKIQYFAIFDGHGGHTCAEFLRDNLHNIIATQACFPKDIENALI